MRPALREEMVRKALLPFGAACFVLLISSHARARQTTTADDGYQIAVVVSVTKNVSASNAVGDNPIDAPLRANEYSYDIGIRLHCKVYFGRYESATRYLPSVFTPNHEVDVRLRKHLMYISLPFSDEEVMMGIVRRGRVKDEVCLERPSKPVTGQIPDHQLTRSKFKGGLV
jgi:hypothetical protein